MNGHALAKLGAYHDGELDGRQLRQVEAHLAECASCRAELDALRKLSALLAESPAPAHVTSPARFAAQVGLRLPRRPLQPGWRRALGMGWRLAPAGLLGAWAFAQTALLLSGTALLMLRFWPGGVALRAEASLLESLPAYLGVNLSAMARETLQFLSGYTWGVALNLALLGVIGLLYWSWLTSLWAHSVKQET